MESPVFILLDFETTGLNPTQAEIIEIGAVKVQLRAKQENTIKDGQGAELQEIARYQQLLKPKGELPLEIAQLTGITTADLDSSPALEDVARGFLDFIADHPLVAHNHLMEKGFLDHHLAPFLSQKASDGQTEFVVHNSIDAIAMVLPDFHSHAMGSLRDWAGISSEGSHRALQDCLDLLLLLQRLRQEMADQRPQIADNVEKILGNSSWFWLWFFKNLPPAKSSDPVSTFSSSDLRSLTRSDQEREPDWSRKIDFTDIRQHLHGGAEQGLDYRQSQESMALLVAEGLNQGKKIAIEAPTGTGKSLAYLLPGALHAQITQSPLVISTQSKSLQDQLIQKDIPRLQKLMQSQGKEAPKAAVVKGQENYLCLRKLNESVNEILRVTSVGEPDQDQDLDLGQSHHQSDKMFGVETSALEERWSAALMLNLATTSPTVEVQSVSRYLQNLYPSLGKLVEDVRSQHMTTIGPRCPFYQQCHFFNSARQAHHADIIIANHSLVFQWPNHLPRIRNLIFDEAHHLEGQITQAFSHHLSGRILEDQVERWLKRSRGQQRKKNDVAMIATTLQDILPQPLPAWAMVAGEDYKTYLKTQAEKLRNHLKELQDIVPQTFSNRSGLSPHFEHSQNLAQQNYPQYPALMAALKNLKASVDETADFLRRALEITNEGKKFQKGQNHGYDLLAAAGDRFAHFQAALQIILSNDESPSQENLLRLLHWHPGQLSWRLEALPIQVAELSAPVFEQRRSVVLTSATLSAGTDQDFFLKRVGLKPSEKMLTLPSPFTLEKQAKIYFPNDVAVPGTEEHLQALIDFSEKMVRQLNGRTLLLMTSNARLRQAAVELRERLQADGIQVFDSVMDSRAAENFRSQPRSLLIGGEKYGEGLDIPGDNLSCVIIEKINEAMTRGPLPEARKAQTRFPLFDYDFPLRMMWLKQRVGRLIRTATDSGHIIVFDSRYVRWSASSRQQVHSALKPYPIIAMGREAILDDVRGFSAPPPSAKSPAWSNQNRNPLSS